jgi:hypothetical protein
LLLWRLNPCCKSAFIACKLHMAKVEIGKGNRWLKRAQRGAADLARKATCNKA